MANWTHPETDNNLPPQGGAWELPLIIHFFFSVHKFFEFVTWLKFRLTFIATTGVPNTERDGRPSSGLLKKSAQAGMRCEGAARRIRTRLHLDRDADAIDLCLLVGGQPHAAVIWPAARDGFGESEARQQGKPENEQAEARQGQFSNLSERMEYSSTVKPNGLVQTSSMERRVSGRNLKRSVAVKRPV